MDSALTLKMPEVLNTTGLVCLICHSSFEKGSDVMLLVCGHVLCDECESIYRVFNPGFCCPLCDREVDPITVCTASGDYIIEIDT